MPKRKLASDSTEDGSSANEETTLSKKEKRAQAREAAKAYHESLKLERQEKERRQQDQQENVSPAPPTREKMQEVVIPSNSEDYEDSEEDEPVQKRARQSLDAADTSSKKESKAQRDARRREMAAAFAKGTLFQKTSTGASVPVALPSDKKPVAPAPQPVPVVPAPVPPRQLEASVAHATPRRVNSSAGRHAGPFNSPMPVPVANAASSAQVAAGPRMPDFGKTVANPPKSTTIRSTSTHTSNLLNDDHREPRLLQRSAAVPSQPAQQVHPTTTENKTTSAQVYSTSDEEQDDDDDEVEVLSGGEAHEGENSEGNSDEDEDEQEDQEESEEQKTLLSSFKRAVFWTVLFMGLSITCYVISLMDDRPQGIFSRLKTTQLSLSTCYLDSNDAIVSVPVEQCIGVPVEDWSPCPESAVCAGGIIVHCQNHYSLEQNQCILSQTANDTVRRMIGQLENWTIADICNAGGNPYAVSHSAKGRPFFGFSQLMAELDTGMEWVSVLGHFSNQLVLELREDGDMRIALHDSHRVVYPGSCVVKNFLRYGLEWFSYIVLSLCTLVLTFLLSAFSVYFSLAREVPFMTMIFTVVVPFSGWLVMAYVQKRQFAEQERRKLEMDRVLVRQEVYKSLSAAPKEYHPVVLVRDRILFDPSLPYHAKQKSRDRVLHKLWPRVVADISKDNRIQKVRMMSSEGVLRDCWKWNDVVA